MIDNYDSFTYNLVQRIGEMDNTLELRVFRNDKTSVEEGQKLRPDHVIISPGPCTPTEAGVSNDMVKVFAGKVPLLGVCLGHQCIAHSYGMRIVRNDRIMHGKTSPIHHDGKTIFQGIASPFIATRYHSLIIERKSFNHDLFEINAWTDEDEIMGIRAKPNVFGEEQMPLEGVQFHPESFLTSEGPHLLGNFLGISAEKVH